MTERTHYEVALDEYKARGYNFLEELDYHMTNGWVVSTPHCFGMGYFYEDEGKTVVHVSYATGDMGFLIRFSLNIKLDIIEFERNFSGKSKRYDFNRFSERFL